MKKNNLYLSFIVTFAMFLTLVTPINAVGIETNNNFYKEQGQINLKNLDIQLDNNKVITVVAKNRNIETTIEKARLICHLEDSNELKENFKNILVNNSEVPEVIGYTKIYFDEEGGFDQNPMTIDEYDEPTEMSPGRNFTLYTNVYRESYSGVYYYQTIGTYSSTSAGSSSTYYDYVTLNIPSAYTLVNASLLSPSVNSYKEKETNNSVGYKVKLGNYKKVILNANKSNNSLAASRKTISHYLHTRGTVNVSFIVSTNSLGFSVTSGTSYWQLASSVTTICQKKYCL